MHLHHAADALALHLDRVIDRGASFQLAGVDAHKSQRADKGVGGNLKRQCSKGCLVIRLSYTLLAIFQLTFNGLYFGGGRQVLNHCV